MSSSQNTAGTEKLGGCGGREGGYVAGCSSVGKGVKVSMYSLVDLRTQGIAVSKSAVHVQLRHLAVWLILLLLLNTHPFGQV